MMKKINDGFEGVGELIHGNMKESMSKALSTANEELRLSSLAVGQWEKNHEISTLNVKEKIKQQQAAYDNLLELFDEMEEKTYAFDKALQQWEKNSLVHATRSMYSTFLGLRFPDIFKVNSGMEEIKETASVMQIMEQLHYTFSRVARTLEYNVKYDSEAINEGKFQPSEDFKVALQESSNWLERALDFKTVEDAAENLTIAIDKLTGYSDPRVHDLKYHMSKISFAGQTFIKLVCMRIKNTYVD